MRHLSPAWFAIVMGWCGLSMAWQAARTPMGEGAEAAALLGSALAAAVATVLLVLSLARARWHPQAWLEDLAHPVRHAFVAAASVSLLLLGTLGLWQLPAGSSGAAWARELWQLGAGAQLIVTIWVLRRWLAQRLSPGALTPVHLIAIVGNVLVPLGGIEAGHPIWSAWQFTLGLSLWPLLTWRLYQLGQRGPALPPPLRPAWAIVLAPPSVIGVAGARLLTLSPETAAAQVPWLATTWLLATTVLAWLWRTHLAAIKDQPFGLSHWALSFPLAAYVSLTLVLGTRTGWAWVNLWGLLGLALVSLLVIGLSMATIRAIRQGQLPAPDPAPPTPPKGVAQ